MDQLNGAVGQVGAFLQATANPIQLVHVSQGGRSWILSAQVQAYALALALAFVAVLLGAGAIVAEREENVLGRLVGGLAGFGRLVAEKIAFVTLIAAGLGLRARARVRPHRRARARLGRAAVAAAAAAPRGAPARGGGVRRLRRPRRRARPGGGDGDARRVPGRAAAHARLARPARDGARGGVDRRPLPVRPRGARVHGRALRHPPRRPVPARVRVARRASRSSTASPPGRRRGGCSKNARGPLRGPRAGCGRRSLGRDRNPVGLRLDRLRRVELQHALREDGLHLRRVRLGRKLEAAQELAVQALVEAERLVRSPPSSPSACP